MLSDYTFLIHINKGVVILDYQLICMHIGKHNIGIYVYPV